MSKFNEDEEKEKLYSSGEKEAVLKQEKIILHKTENESKDDNPKTEEEVEVKNEQNEVETKFQFKVITVNNKSF
jgi:hypothetical protein